MNSSSVYPQGFIWELTYACPFRCDHCYSESGRRPSRQVPVDVMQRIARALVRQLPAPVVNLAGGEPLIVKGLLEVAETLRAGGARSHLYTSGWRLHTSVAHRAAQLFDVIAVSLDGPDSDVDDFLRGRKGAFEQAMSALEMWNEVARQRNEHGLEPFQLGIECTVMRNNFDHLERFCTQVAPRLPHLSYIAFGTVFPVGLASRNSFCERELLTREQVAGANQRYLRLQELAPPSVKVRWGAVESSLRLARGDVPVEMMTIEPDGLVKAHPMYEGTVGNILDEPIDVLWQRTRDWTRHPFVARELGSIQSFTDWARAARNLDARFASLVDQRRLLRRRPAEPLPGNLPVRMASS